MKLGLQQMSIKSLITRNWLATEMRVVMNQRKAEQYASEMASGDNFPAPVVFIDKQEITRIGDEFHRILANQINGAKSLEVDLRRGERLDAIIHNIEANKSQRGMPFSSGDKHKAISTLLFDPVASKWNQTKIAEIVGCTGGYVSTVAKLTKAPRPEMIVDKNGYLRSKQVEKQPEKVAERRVKIRKMLEEGKMQTEIADKLNIGRSTVQRCIEADKRDEILVTCPHCNGTGVINSGLAKSA